MPFDTFLPPTQTQLVRAAVVAASTLILLPPSTRRYRVGSFKQSAFRFGAVAVGALSLLSPSLLLAPAGVLVWRLASVRSGSGAVRRVSSAVGAAAGVTALSIAAGRIVGHFDNVSQSAIALVVVGLALFGVSAYLNRPKLDSRVSFSKAQKDEIAKRDGNVCNYCGVPPSHAVVLQGDHVVPRSEGGRTEVSNGQLLCPPDNNLKLDHSDRRAREMFLAKHGYEAGSFRNRQLVRS